MRALAAFLIALSLPASAIEITGRVARLTKAEAESCFVEEGCRLITAAELAGMLRDARRSALEDLKAQSDHAECWSRT